MKTKEELIKYLENEIWFRVGPSEIHGVGLFAIRDIPKGTIITKELDTEDNRVSVNKHKDLINVPPAVMRILESYNTAVFYDGPLYDIWIPACYKKIHLWWLNDSSDKDFNNIEFKSDSEQVITTRDIEAGDELVLPLIDYRKHNKNSEEDE